MHVWRLTPLPKVLLFRGWVWALLVSGCVGMALGALDSGAENRAQLGPQFHSTMVSGI